MPISGHVSRAHVHIVPTTSGSILLCTEVGILQVYLHQIVTLGDKILETQYWLHLGVASLDVLVHAIQVDDRSPATILFGNWEYIAEETLQGLGQVLWLSSGLALCKFHGWANKCPSLSACQQALSGDACFIFVENTQHDTFPFLFQADSLEPHQASETF